MSESARNAVIQVEHDWASAMVRGDWSTLDKKIAADWILIDPMGQRQRDDTGGISS